jgi:CTP:molybdopterin cytidylyltransferase MocA
LRDAEYHAVEPDAADGLLKSVVYPGLWLDKAALLRGDMPAVLAALHRGLASPGHAAFAATLHPDAGGVRGTLAGPADL